MGIESLSNFSLPARQRIGGKILRKQVKRALEELIERGAMRSEDNDRWRRYWAVT